MEWVLASDIDNTLTGDRPALERLTRHLEAERAGGELFLILSTGRRLDQVLSGVRDEGLPQPDAVISQVGTEIYLPPLTEDAAPLPAWDRLLHGQFERAEALAFLAGEDGLELQPEQYNTALKVSAFLDSTPDPDETAGRIRQRIAAAGLADRFQVVWSSGIHLDIIPAAAGKGNAIRFLLDHLSLSPRRVLVAGDSGNDRSMFLAYSGIIVANAQPELMRLREEQPEAGHFFATEPYAAGVAEGLRHFGML